MSPRMTKKFNAKFSYSTRQSQDLYLARVYFGISTKLNLLPRLISQISIKIQNPESRIQDKRETYRALFE